MKMKFLAVLAGAAIIATGCRTTVSDTHAFATTWSKDNLSNRYQRSPDQVYHASVTVIQNNGVLTREFISPSTNNIPIRSLEGKVNQKNVWIRVQSVDSSTTEVTVQARSDWGVSDVDLAHELSTEIGIQLAR